VVAGADPGVVTQGFADAFRAAAAIAFGAALLALTALRRSDVAVGMRPVMAH
jgi:hypothetical protein